MGGRRTGGALGAGRLHLPADLGRHRDDEPAHLCEAEGRRCTGCCCRGSRRRRASSWCHARRNRRGCIANDGPMRLVNSPLQTVPRREWVLRSAQERCPGCRSAAFRMSACARPWHATGMGRATANTRRHSPAAASLRPPSGRRVRPAQRNLALEEPGFEAEVVLAPHARFVRPWTGVELSNHSTLSIAWPQVVVQLERSFKTLRWRVGALARWRVGALARRGRA